MKMIVKMAILATAVALLAPATFSQTVLRVMPMGDSITYGVAAYGGYRAPLYQLLTDAGFAVDFVGNETANGVASLPDSDHEGHPGYRIDQIDSGWSAWINAISDPDVILLMIGTNDYGQDYNTATAKDRLDLLISKIVADRPQARVVVANLTLRTDYPSMDTAIQTTFNPFVPGIVASHQALGHRVFFLDMRSVLGASDLADKLHPNQTGYNKMADTWLSAITNIITPGILDFNASLPTNDLNSVAVPAIYQPIPNLNVSFSNAGLFNGGPDHTTGIAGGSHYNLFQLDGAATPLTCTFDKPVEVPSLWLSTYYGGNSGNSTNVTITAYSDAAGTVQLTNVVVATEPHATASGYIWAEYTGLTALGTNIMALSFDSTGNAQVDDITLNVSTNIGPLQDFRFTLPITNFVATMTRQGTAYADYLYSSNLDVTADSGIIYTSSDTNVATVTAGGLVEAISGGTATITATFDTHFVDVVISVAGGSVINFNDNPAGLSYGTLPSGYQPLPGLIIGYDNVGLYNGGPDHTTGVTGNSNYNSYQKVSSAAQIFTFSKAVSVPSMWLTSYTGAGSTITINAYRDTAGTSLLGTETFATTTHPNGNSYVWAECTALDTPTYNGQIQRLEFACADYAQVDDISVVFNTNTTSTLQGVTMTLPSTNLFQNMQRQATVIAAYDSGANLDVTTGNGVVYTSSDPSVASIITNGLIQTMGVGMATLTATLQDKSNSVDIVVTAGTLIDFSDIAAGLSYEFIPTDYQPIPGLSIGYGDVGLYNGGPDHTTGVTGNSNYNSYQKGSPAPQIFTFSKAVSVPSMWLTCYLEGGSTITINAYSDTAGTSLLGMETFATTTHATGNSFVWAECTALDSATYNGQIQRLEFSATTDYAQVDDMLVIVSPMPAYLDIVHSAGSLTVQWPTDSDTGTLMQSPVLGTNEVWTPVSGSPSVVGSNYLFSVPVTNPTAFFRMEY